jgi:hypothetical protein
VADKYPSATVEGLDLSAIQPTYVPPNLKFIINDIEEEWVYRPNSYAVFTPIFAICIDPI